MPDVSVEEAAGMLRELSEPWSSGEGVKSALERTRKLAGLAYWRAYDLWYEKARKVEPQEVEKIKEALRSKNEKAALNELRDLKFRIAKLEATLVSRDPDFHRPDIDFAGELLRNAGGMDRAGTRGGRGR